LYKAQWIRDCYPGPSEELCRSFRSRHSGMTVCSYLFESNFEGDVPAEIAAQWAAEGDGAFHQADTLEKMRFVALNYPMLLRPAIQGALDSHDESHPDNARLRLLQQLREDVEGRPIKSWWRPGGDPDPVSGRRS